MLNTQQQALMMTGMENLERSIRKAHDEEVASMENNIGILATTEARLPSSVFGTVIGIMNSLQDIAASGSASFRGRSGDLEACSPPPSVYLPRFRPWSPTTIW